MDIWFGSPSKEKLFNSEKKLRKKYGDRMATLLMQRLLDLSGCENFKEAYLLPGRLHALVGRGLDFHAMDLVQPHRLIIRISNDPIPFIEDSKTEIDFELVDEIEIVGVVNYH